MRGEPNTGFSPQKREVELNSLDLGRNSAQTGDAEPLRGVVRRFLQSPAHTGRARGGVRKRPKSADSSVDLSELATILMQRRASPSRGGSGVLYQCEPLVPPAHLYAGRLGGRPPRVVLKVVPPAQYHVNCGKQDPPPKAAPLADHASHLVKVLPRRGDAHAAVVAEELTAGRHGAVGGLLCAVLVRAPVLHTWQLCARDMSRDWGCPFFSLRMVW